MANGLKVTTCPRCKGSGWDDRIDNDCGCYEGDLLLTAIRIASNPHAKAPHYVQARREAVRLTRAAVREIIASEWRENLKASAALPCVTSSDTRIRHDGASWVDLDQRSNYTGD